MTTALITIGSVLTLVLTDGSAGSSEAAPTGPAEKAGSVTISDFKYDPPVIQATAGSEIKILNEDTAQHTITAEDGSFDSGTVLGGDEGSVTVDQAGTYEYFCNFHPYMKGSVEVK